jgi:predicted nuclease of predicted toxin-antitoxin system
MGFLADQDVYAVTVRLLNALGHDVVRIAELGLAQATDVELLQFAEKENRVFVTRDRDFGGLVFVGGLGKGVVYLRVLPSTQGAVHAELERVLTTYSEEQLRNALVVIEPGRHRFRTLPGPRT